MSDHSTTIHATASAGTDALRNPGPVVRANSMRAGLLNRGRTLGIGCWNVRTLLDPGTQSLTARSLHQYNVDVCCLSEVRLPDSGSREIKIPGVESHFTLYHSGPLDSSGRHGVAIALSQQADLALLAWEPVNDRMAYVRLKGHFTNISIVAVYSPTSAAEQRDKEAFYSQLQALVERLPRRDLLIVAGDWNGRTGPGDSTTSHLLGRFGLGSRCENGERLLNFADRNRLLVTNTCFQHRKKHLLTWYSNDGRTASQIDYILVSSRFRSWVHDSRSMRGAETGNAHGSDHVLVQYLDSLFECRYADFFLYLAAVEQYMHSDRYFAPHARYYVREMRIRAYSQHLDSYSSLSLESMAATFGVTMPFLDAELSHFIANGRLACKIDKVAGIVETTRPDNVNSQYQAMIKHGDILLNRIQKLSQVINI
nr:unnamed protein product [Spirometra erinaceieuropaei]